MAGDNPDGFKRALENVALVSGTVNRLVDLASIWESEDLLAHDRLEIWPLLNECWLRQEAHALSKKLTVRLINRVEGVDLPVVYSSHFWLARVISESLWAAIKAVPNGGTLDIELRQMGPRMLIVFNNSGMWPARAEDATLLANPNAQPAVDGKTESVKAPPPPNAKDLIGFHLCQRILITEDQPDIRKLIRMTLEFEDYEIREAPDGTEGLRIVREFHSDLVLLDIMMPGELDGQQVCRRIKADPQLSQIRVILLTARWLPDQALQPARAH